MEYSRTAGRSDFIGGIDNEALDFGQLDQFIHAATATGSPSSDNNVGINPTVGATPTTTSNISVTVTGGPTQSHLPESPPDSGSEPPYSPADLQALTLPPTTPNSITSRGVTITTNGGDNNNAGGNSNLSGAVRPANTTSGNGITTIENHQTNQLIGVNHLAIIGITVPPNHVIPPPHPPGSTDTSQAPNDLSEDLATLTDISQTSLDLHSIGDLQSPHQNHHNTHHSILNTHQHSHFPLQQHLSHQQQQQHMQQQVVHQHQHQHQQQLHHLNALYIRTNPTPDPQNTQCKHDDLLHDPHQTPPDQQLILQQTGVTYLDLERNCRNDLITNTHPHQSVLGAGSMPINNEDLSRIIPEVYNGTSTDTPPITMASTRINLKTTGHGRKRKISTPDSGPPLVKPEPGTSVSPVCSQQLETDSSIGSNVPQNLSIPDTSLDGNMQNTDSTGSGESCSMQCIRFTPFQQQNWHVLCDQSLQELPVPHYRIDADKGFNFSNSDDAFVCQKKNHFQITCHAQLQGNAAFVRTSSGLEKIKSFYLHFYGVKLEAPNHMIRVEQSQSDRSKKPFHPVPIDLQDRLVSKVTVGRLHFSETTSNNMRKKGRPNPEQRYFQLVVGLHAHTHSGHFPVVSQGSERIIVRASNPGQFESDVDLCWSRGVTQDSIFHAGRVGINTDRPDESLVVHGNIKVSGHIVQPSDSRAKQEINELDTSEQLKNLQKIRIVKYRYEPEFAVHSGLKGQNDTNEIIDTGVIAQEVREVLPDAVQEAGSIVLPNGQVIENFLLVNKDRILMENIGAVKELCKVTGSLETRIEQLEKINSRLVRMQQLDRSHKCETKKCKHLTDDFDETEEICSNKTIQIIIIILVIIMATCLVAISTLYFVEHSKQGGRYIARYDRYDVNQYISHDAILINNNAPTNRNGYYVDRRHQTNSKSTIGTLLNPFTVRPQSQHSTTIQSKSISSSEDPPQEIITYYHFPPDKNGHINANSNNNNNHSNNHGKDNGNIDDNSADSNENDHILNNKGGIKWPPPSDEDSPSETSSEKVVAESILLPQDVENNSIDGDHTQKPRLGGRKINGKKVTPTTHKPNNDNSSNIEFNKEILPITNKSRADAEDTDLQNLSNSSDNENQQTIFELSANPTLSRVINIEPIGSPVYCENSMTRDVAECQSVCCGETNNLSVQFNENYSNDEKSKFEIDTRQSNLTTVVKNTQSSGSVSGTQKLHLKPTVNSDQSSSAHVPSSTLEIRNRESIFIEVDEVKKTFKLTETTEIKTQNEHTKQLQGPGTGGGGSSVAGAGASAAASVVGNANHHHHHHHHHHRPECFPISVWIRSETFNVSLGSETFCFSSGHNLNMTYSVPLSKYMKENKIELHFIGSNRLQWILCSNKPYTLTRDYPPIGKETEVTNNNINNRKIFQKNPNKSLFFVNLPNFGFFERHVLIRAAINLNKNTCQEQPDNTSNILEYNFRIFRDCDK